MNIFVLFQFLLYLLRRDKEEDEARLILIPPLVGIEGMLGVIAFKGLRSVSLYRRYSDEEIIQAMYAKYQMIFWVAEESGLSCTLKRCDNGEELVENVHTDIPRFKWWIIVGIIPNKKKE